MDRAMYVKLATGGHQDDKPPLAALWHHHTFLGGSLDAFHGKHNPRLPEDELLKLDPKKSKYATHQLLAAFQLRIQLGFGQTCLALTGQRDMLQPEFQILSKHQHPNWRCASFRVKSCSTIWRSQQFSGEELVLVNWKAELLSLLPAGVICINARASRALEAATMSKANKTIYCNQ
eukprot:7949838-Ditylum_brightwellii.AAC.1